RSASADLGEGTPGSTVAPGAPRRAHRGRGNGAVESAALQVDVGAAGGAGGYGDPRGGGDGGNADRTSVTGHHGHRHPAPRGVHARLSDRTVAGRETGAGVRT